LFSNKSFIHYLDIEVELKCGVLSFVLNCLNSDVLLHSMLFLHWVVSLRLANTSCLVVSFFSLPAIVPDKYFALGYKQILVKARDWTRFVKAPVCSLQSLSYSTYCDS